MSDFTTNSRLRYLSQVAALAITAGVGAGCSGDVTRLDTLFEPTSNRTATMGQATPAGDVTYTGSLQNADPAPRTPVASNALPPVQGAPTASDYNQAPSNPMMRPPTADYGAQAPAVYAPAPAVATANVAGQAVGPGWSGAGGSSVTLRPGETVKTLATRYNVPESAILKVNGLSSASQAPAGSQIVIPVYNSAARPATAAPTAPQMPGAPSMTSPSVAVAPPARPLGQLPANAPATASAGGVYVVKSGDSLGRIANDHGMRSVELAAANGINASDPIRVGQTLRIPQAGQAGAAPTQVAQLPSKTMTDAARPTPAPARPAAAAAAAPAGTPAAPAPTKPAATGLAPMPSNRETEQQIASVAPTAPVAAAPAPSQSQASASDTGASKSFRWPVNGRVISSFGKKPNGERNDGINLDAPEGTPIKAAEGGTVIYSGNELKGYGNLVLIKHSNGMVSAYAHASELLVRRGDEVRRGQMIGRVGATGSVSRPQLHFELREGNRPVDPSPYLNG
ncbi:peptidoglycan DD-metalloendopeptidase family protein [Methylobrevis pamukkalensis]|uniref:Murein hydrolase activator NlpD n=1 Tax=Methylobrevis pamukkalensis TaxID=1439726 RepID=A0A1E3GYY4_9HYPH|nr:peptidoglycan DD-metalloendopeptidase family protein [Methylobrevis pamukkalensis]ODN69270.1 Murein hydrolase activator NlpD precursor [Methylobrevis pamukkalensis]